MPLSSPTTPETKEKEENKMTYYPNKTIDFLSQRGARVGSQVALTTSDDHPWRGWIISPPEGAARSGDERPPMLYLMTEDGDCLGLALAQIKALKERGHQPWPQAQGPPAWPSLQELPPGQPSLFARVQERQAPNAIHIIEWGQTMAAYVLAPGPSTPWHESIASQWRRGGPLVYQTAAQRDGSWRLLAWQLQAALAHKAAGIVLLHRPDARGGLAASMGPWAQDGLPCPLVGLASAVAPAGDIAGLAQRQDAFLAATYAARYLDVGAPVTCQPAPLEAPHTDPTTPWRTPPTSHQGRAPLGSYHFTRMDPATTQPPLATLHRGQLILQTLHARPLKRPHQG